MYIYIYIQAMRDERRVQESMKDYAVREAPARFAFHGLRPISLLKLSRLRFVDSKYPGNFLWA